MRICELREKEVVNVTGSVLGISAMWILRSVQAESAR